MSALFKSKTLIKEPQPPNQELGLTICFNLATELLQFLESERHRHQQNEEVLDI